MLMTMSVTLIFNWKREWRGADIGPMTVYGTRKVIHGGNGTDNGGRRGPRVTS